MRWYSLAFELIAIVDVLLLLVTIPWILLIAIVDVLLLLVTIPWILTVKKDATSAMAWCLLVFFLPIVGFLLFLFLGWQSVHRPLKRKREHRRRRAGSDQSRRAGSWAPVANAPGEPAATGGPSFEGIDRLAVRFGAFPATRNNHVVFYHDGAPAFEAMFAAFRAAEHHIHIETFIFQPDEMGREVVQLLAAKARTGVEVRLLYDAMGSHSLSASFLRPLTDAGGKCSVFLPLNPFRRRIQINLRDHRKIAVVDGRVAFTGGLNFGNEYLGKDSTYGYWRDTHMRLEGPAVADLQSVFVENWDFAADEALEGRPYFPPQPRAGDVPVQVIQSGPDQELKSIREMYFASIQRARRRLWIATPYFVPDMGLLNALALAGYQGIDVRILGQFRPDKWIPYYASLYHWASVMDAGVKIYQYTRGMMHSKVVIVDGEWASVGTANLDNRSLHLNFEVNCMIYSPVETAELERAFRVDLGESIRLDREVFSRRPFAGRLVENACRLLSPVL